jgi:hypothetical protein
VAEHRGLGWVEDTPCGSLRNTVKSRRGEIGMRLRPAPVSHHRVHRTDVSTLGGGPLSHGRGGHPLTAPEVSPDTTDRRKISTRIAIGSVTATAAAKIVP